MSFHEVWVDLPQGRVSALVGGAGPQLVVLPREYGRRWGRLHEQLAKRAVERLKIGCVCVGLGRTTWRDHRDFQECRLLRIQLVEDLSDSILESLETLHV